MSHHSTGKYVPRDFSQRISQKFSATFRFTVNIYVQIVHWFCMSICKKKKIVAEERLENYISIPFVKCSTTIHAIYSVVISNDKTNKKFSPWGLCIKHVWFQGRGGCQESGVGVWHKCRQGGRGLEIRKYRIRCRIKITVVVVCVAKNDK